ncbi:MAG: hypothetical protein ABI647_13840 [Gemmatimonadota bacterium]
MRAWTSLVVAVVAAPLAAQAKGVNPDLVSLTVRASEGAAYDRLIFLTNGNAETVIVTSLRLVECVNVDGGCGATRNAQLRVLPDQEVLLLRVKAGAVSHPPKFKLSYTWKPERTELGPEVEVLFDHSSPPDTLPVTGVRKRDAAVAAAVDSIVVAPATVTVHVGATLNLGKVLRMTALDAEGKTVPGITFRMAVDTGKLYARLSGGILTGLKPGSALLLISPPQPPGTASVHPKGASRVTVTVVP